MGGMKVSAAWQKLTALGYKPKKTARKKFTFKVEKDKQSYFFGYDDSINATQFLRITTVKHRFRDDNLIVHADMVYYPEKEISLINENHWSGFFNYGIPFIEFQGDLLQIPKDDKMAIRMLEDKAYYPLYDYLSERK